LRTKAVPPLAQQLSVTKGRRRNIEPIEIAPSETALVA
jgi:hypothetical protein